MTLPVNLSQRERDKFTEVDNLPAVRIKSTATINAVVNVGSPNQASISLDTSTAWIGLATTVIGSAPTLYALVNTSQQGQASVVLDLGTNFIGLTTTVIGSAPTLYAVVNVGAAGGQSSVVLSAGVDWIGMATVNISNNLTFGSNVTLNASNAYIGLATVNIGSSNKITWDSGATVAVSNLPAVTWTSGATVSVGNPLPGGSNFIGLISAASIQGEIKLVASTAQIGSASVFWNSGATVAVSNLPAVTWTSGATVSVGLALPAGNNFIGLATVTGNVNLPTGDSKTLNIVPIALSATNLSGATLFVASASKKYYITDLILSTASNVGVAFMSDVTYLVGNASLRMQLAPQGGFVENGDPTSPLYFGLAAQKSFSVVTDTATPIAGKVSWYEE